MNEKIGKYPFGPAAGNAILMPGRGHLFHKEGDKS
jgi:hypothetical protein